AEYAAVEAAPASLAKLLPSPWLELAIAAPPVILAINVVIALGSRTKRATSTPYRLAAVALPAACVVVWSQLGAAFSPMSVVAATLAHRTHVVLVSDAPALGDAKVIEARLEKM